MSSAGSQRGILRWKEWVPLITQQQRLRNLIQVIAYNVQAKDENGDRVKGRILYYYTIHLSTTSSSIYTSEKLESENPKWAEIEIPPQSGAATGIVIRLWADSGGDTDRVLDVWGVYFSGLVYIGSRLLCADPTALGPNSLVFHMHGGYFTAPHCFKHPPPTVPRTYKIQLNATAVKPSYSVKLMEKLQFLQQTIKRETASTNMLREQISAGCFKDADGYQMNRGTTGSAFRKLLIKPEAARAHPQQILAVKRRIEQVKFRLQLLSEEKDKEKTAVQKITGQRDALKELNSLKSIELQEKQNTLHKDLEGVRELRKQLQEIKSYLRSTTALLDYRQKHLISDLSFIYPIKESADGRFTIRDVHLPNSEDFDGKDELMVSVALGFVAHLVQMIAYFLNIPTRYPIIHFGSRSKIVDHIIDTIPDKEREFPLYSRGKEKLSFDYGVFLLNKNIAQLRWCCGLTTSDLRPTLLNLVALMTQKPKQKESPREWNRVWRDEGNPPLSFSLDRGLDAVSDPSVDLVGSDPQDYLQTHRISSKRCETDRVPDLPNLMTLDITCQPYETEEYGTPAAASSPDLPKMGSTSVEPGDIIGSVESRNGSSPPPPR